MFNMTEQLKEIRTNSVIIFINMEIIDNFVESFQFNAERQTTIVWGVVV